MPDSSATPPRPATILKQCRHGRMIFPAGDVYIGGSLSTYGEYSELEVALLEQMVGPGDVVVEIGANIGAHTVSLARRVAPGGAVLAFEPQRIIYQMLCANLMLNELFNVQALHAASGAETAMLKVPPVDYTAIANFGGLSLTPPDTPGEEVMVLPLDRFNLAALRLLKIDVEGMEREVLLGARGHILRHRPFIYVENDRRAKSPALIGTLREFGYRLYWHVPELFNPANFVGNADNIFPGIASVNLICVPVEMPLAVSPSAREVSGPDDWFFPDEVAAA